MNQGLSKYHLEKCSLCRDKGEFYCNTCKQNLCAPCEIKHLRNLYTKYHDVVNYRAKAGDFIIPEKCGIHPNKMFKCWCHSCEQPICFACIGHGNHEISDIRFVYKEYRQKYRDTIVNIRSDILLFETDILESLKTSVNTNYTLRKIKQKITKQAQRLKNHMDEIISKRIYYLRCMMEQRKQAMEGHISFSERYEHSYEHSAREPVQFLLSKKKIYISSIWNKFAIFAFIFSDEIKMSDSDFLIEFEIMERRRTMVGSNTMLRLMPKPLLKESVPLINIPSVYHISYVTSDRVWVSHLNNLFLINIAGDTLFQLNDVTNASSFGVHSVNKEGDLIYIDRNHDILISSDYTNKSILVRKSKKWIPLCIFSSSHTGDLLVGMGNEFFDRTTYEYIRTKVIRYNSQGKYVHTIKYNDEGEKLYYHPTYITENGNEDIVVADVWSLKVTDYNGKHRFTYTGNPSVSGDTFTAHGICTDALLNILVCDVLYRTVHLIDKDGNFLSYLFTEEQEFFRPTCIAYDHRTHRLWYGQSDALNSTARLHIYRHINIENSVTD